MESSDAIKGRTGILHGKRILITQAGDFMGPMLCEVLAEHGAQVVASRAVLSEPSAAESLVATSGAVDVLVANLAIPAPSTPAV
jgi:2-keto-3-deoxy-L-fuconate dehydrogenase